MEDFSSSLVGWNFILPHFERTQILAADVERNRYKRMLGMTQRGYLAQAAR